MKYGVKIINLIRASTSANNYFKKLTNSKIYIAIRYPNILANLLDGSYKNYKMLNLIIKQEIRLKEEDTQRK